MLICNKKIGAFLIFAAISVSMPTHGMFARISHFAKRNVSSAAYNIMKNIGPFRTPSTVVSYTGLNLLPQSHVFTSPRLYKTFHQYRQKYQNEFDNNYFIGGLAVLGFSTALIYDTKTAHAQEKPDIFQCLEDGNIKQIRQLLKKDPTLANAKNNNGYTVLNEAVCNGHKDVVQLLLTNNADANSNEALIMAAIQGYKEIAELLIEYDADVNKKSWLGQNTALICAASNGNNDIAELLIKHDADVNAKNNAGYTALMYVVRWNNTKIVKLLLKYGADVNEKDDFGMTALMIAAKYGHKDVVDLLLKHRANVNEKNEFGDTALMMAFNTGHDDVAELIFEYAIRNKIYDHLQRMRVTILQEMEEKKDEIINEGVQKTMTDVTLKATKAIVQRVMNEESFFEKQEEADKLKYKLAERISAKIVSDFYARHLNRMNKNDETR